MEMKKQKNYLFRIIVTILIILFMIVSFYTFNVHIPYVNHQKDLIQVRDKIIRDNHLNYDGYFNAYDREKTIYIIKVKENNASVYQAYDYNYKILKSYQGTSASKNFVKSQIKKKYKVDVSNINIGYENDKFLYYGSYQTDNHLYYYYYSFEDGTFIKEYIL
ncbi:hypothetical protein HMPREF9943_00448 [Eggerthia catenaformis OT 569 = DSM 20559]|uniref:DUF5590 domain-containing protein n=1 Tax=Eggerthia catenaformis OT 569 = DSM 20559 TaxID=999415 RepID=M2Q315_9FIRM|nr:hypothetical protein [Eggerthia catenaformis]EMD17295.1 hypothetical protein HMPREF9943_00448 [Eggerthia catenaformis OT 569 = DSM 20559]